MSTQVEPGSGAISLLPHPKEMTSSTNMVLLSNSSILFSSNGDIQALLQLFHSELKYTGITLKSSEHKNREADVIFELDSSLAKEEYHLKIDKTIQVTGGS